MAIRNWYAAHPRLKILSICLALYLLIGLVIGLSFLHDQLVRQTNWICPPGTYDGLTSDLPVSSNHQLAPTCERTFSVLDGILMVGSGMLMWPVAVVFGAVKGLSGF